MAKLWLRRCHHRTADWNCMVLLCLHFGFHGSHEARQPQMGNIVQKEDDNAALGHNSITGLMKAAGIRAWISCNLMNYFVHKTTITSLVYAGVPHNIIAHMKMVWFFLCAYIISPTAKQTRSTAIEDKNGSFLTNDSEVLTRWTKYCRELYSYNLQPDQDLLNTTMNINKEKGDAPILQEEIIEVAKSLKPGKSPGPIMF